MKILRITHQNNENHYFFKLLHNRTKKIMKFLNFNANHKNNANLIIQFQNYENHEILRIQRQNHENHENLSIQRTNNENHEMLTIPRQNLQKLSKFMYSMPES